MYPGPESLRYISTVSENSTHLAITKVRAGLTSCLIKAFLPQELQAGGDSGCPRASALAVLSCGTSPGLWHTYGVLLPGTLGVLQHTVMHIQHGWTHHAVCHLLWIRGNWASREEKHNLSEERRLGGSMLNG